MEGFRIDLKTFLSLAMPKHCFSNCQNENVRLPNFHDHIVLLHYTYDITIAACLQ